MKKILDRCGRFDLQRTPVPDTDRVVLTIYKQLAYAPIYVSLRKLTLIKGDR